MNSSPAFSLSSLKFHIGKKTNTYLTLMVEDIINKGGLFRESAYS
jgi:hypothetical protein